MVVLRSIGLDVGGVIIDSLANDSTDTALHGPRFMETTPVPGAFDAVRSLVNNLGSTKVFIISRCGREIEDKTRLWLQGNRFYDFTGFDPANLFFCLTRLEKTPIARDLGLRHFVDDHREVLVYMEGVVDRRYLFGPQPDQVQNVSGMIVVPTWSDALAAIL